MLNFLDEHKTVVASLVGFAILFMWVGSSDVRLATNTATVLNAPQDSLNFPTRTPDQLEPVVQDIRKKIIEGYRIDRNGDLLLYQTTAYEIEYITGFDFFFVNIFAGNPDAIKRDAENWFIGHNLTLEDLCDLPVRFLIRKPVLRDANPGFTTLPTGCSPTMP